MTLLKFKQQLQQPSKGQDSGALLLITTLACSIIFYIVISYVHLLCTQHSKLINLLATVGKHFPVTFPQLPANASFENGSFY